MKTAYWEIFQVVYPFLDKVTQEKIAFSYSAYYDSSGKLLPGKKDDSEFTMYYSLYAKHYDPEAYLSSLREQERALALQERQLTQLEWGIYAQLFTCFQLILVRSLSK